MLKQLRHLAMMKWMLAAVPLKNSIGILLIFFSTLILPFVFFSSCSAESKTKFLSTEISNGLSSKSSVSILDLDSNQEIFSYKSDQNLIPASTLKLITSISALHYLGSSYAFKTQAYLLQNSKNGLSIGIKGGGDPEFTTERAYLFVRRLKLAGINNISSLLLDSSALEDPSSRSGQRAYNAGSDALAFNFNSVGVQICPASKSNLKARAEPLLWEDSIRVVSEVSTGTGSQASIDLSFINPNLIRASGSIGTDSKCVDRYLSNEQHLESLAAFLSNLMMQMGMGTKIKASLGTIPENSEPIIEFESRPLSDLLIGLNHFSTNFSAEQILAAIGGGPEHSILSRSLGLRKVSLLLNKLGIEDFKIEDGSGLSQNNRISTRILTSILQFAWKNPEIRPFLEVSLPILGQSGTLKRRLPPKGDYQVFAKSGTLDGVSSLAGYLHVKSGKTYAFSILQNEVADLNKAHNIEEAILQKVAQQL